MAWCERIVLGAARLNSRGSGPRWAGRRGGATGERARRRVGARAATVLGYGGWRGSERRELGVGDGLGVLCACAGGARARTGVELPAEMGSCWVRCGRERGQEVVGSGVRELG